MNYLAKILLIFSILIVLIFPQNNQKNEKTHSVIDSLIIKGEDLIQFNKNKAESLLTRATQLSDSVFYEQGKILAYCNLAFINYINNKITSCKIFAERALAHSQKLNYSTGIAKANNILGLIDWRKGDYSSAIQFYFDALNYADQSLDKVEVAKSYNYLGLIFWKTGNYPKAFNYLYKSLEIKEELGNRHELSLTLNNIATVYLEVKNYDAVILFAKRALEISEEISSPYSIGRALGILGACYLGKKDISNALNYLNQALVIKRNSGETKGLAYSLIDIGKIRFELEEYDEAQKNFSEALEIMTEIFDSHGLAISYYNLAKVEHKKNNFNEALSLLKLSDSFASKQDLKEILKNNAFEFSSIYEKTGKTNLALNAFKRHSALKDSILNLQVKSQINEIKINYETEQKERENQILKTENQLKNLELSYNKTLLIFSFIFAALFLIAALLYYVRFNNKNKINRILVEKNTEIEKHRRQLSELNTTKDKFFSIIAHDLRNPFVSLINSSSLLLSDFKVLTEDDKIALIESLNRSAKVNLALLENLLTWAKNQKDGIECNPDYFNLSVRMTSSINLFERMAVQKNIRIKNLVDKNIIVFADEYMVDTILRNLIGNALKFTEQNGEVILKTIILKNFVKIFITDNGKGIPQNVINTIFQLNNKVTTAGTAGEPGSGLGLIISREFVEKNSGEIGVESSVDKGSTFWFTLPLK